MKKEIERLQGLTGGANAYMDNGGKLPEELIEDDVDVTISGKPRAKISLEVGR